MNEFSRPFAAQKVPPAKSGDGPRPIVGPYEGSWDDRATPSFFRRLRRVLG